MDDAYDTIIIGGGPSGLSAAIYAARTGLKTLIVDKGEAGGALGSASKIENFPGLTRPFSGKGLIDIFKEQAERFGATFVKDKAIDAELNSNPKKVTLSDRTLSAKTVIIASGSMSRKGGIKGESEFTGKGVAYCAVCDAPHIQRKGCCVSGRFRTGSGGAGYSEPVC